jgi:hypothetical protein
MCSRRRPFEVSFHGVDLQQNSTACFSEATRICLTRPIPFPVIFIGRRTRLQGGPFPVPTSKRQSHIGLGKDVNCVHLSWTRLKGPAGVPFATAANRRSMPGHLFASSPVPRESCARTKGAIICLPRTGPLSGGSSPAADVSFPLRDDGTPVGATARAGMAKVTATASNRISWKGFSYDHSLNNIS